MFNLLSLVLEREPLQMAYRALAADDPRLRGTGLEYLENVLPQKIRELPWPYLGDQRVAKGTKRARQEIVRDLAMTMDPSKK